MNGTFKQRLTKGLVTPALALSAALGAGVPSAHAEEGLQVRADASILLDADSGKILSEQNADAPLGIASMTKMMTEYLLFEAIEQKKVKWDQMYNVTDYTYKISQNRTLSNVPLRRDGSYSIRELYEAMAIYSANAATIAIAETIAGSEEQFVKLMNDKAKQLGLKDYKFVNSTGLNNSDLAGMHPKTSGPKDENVMPARSVAKLGYLLLKRFPSVIETTKIPKKVFRKGTSDAIEMSNWNFMLPGLVYQYEGVDGLKTGTTLFAGHCFTGTAKRGDVRLIAVVMKGVDEKGVGSYKARFDAARALFDYGFTQFSKVQVIQPNAVFSDRKTVPVLKGKERLVAIQATKPVSVLVKTSEKNAIRPVLQLNEGVKQHGLQAPVGKGTVVGKAVVGYSGKAGAGFIDGDGPSSKVVVSQAVERANWFSLALSSVGEFFANLWQTATGLFN